jgi:hypothetical protein
MTYFTGGSAGKSPASTIKAGWVYATFLNKSDVEISFYWVPFSPHNGTKMLWKTLTPGKQFSQRTMKTMVWETKYVDAAGTDVWQQRWLPGSANWKSDVKVRFCSGTGSLEKALKFYICQPKAKAQLNSDRKVQLKQKIKTGKIYKVKKSCAAACKFASGVATADDATRPPSSKCPTTDLNCGLFRASPANLDSIPESCATFSAMTLPAVSESQYQVVTMVEETTAENEQRFGLTSALPTDCRNSLNERILTYTYGDSSNSMYLSVYKGTSATLPGVTFTIETYEADPDTKSDEADPDTKSDEADPDTKSDEADPDTKSDSGLKAREIILIILGSVIVVAGLGFLAYWQFCMRADQLKKDGGVETLAQEPLSPGGILQPNFTAEGSARKQLVVHNKIVPVDHDKLKLPKGESQAKDSVLTAKVGLERRWNIPTGNE